MSVRWIAFCEVVAGQAQRRLAFRTAGIANTREGKEEAGQKPSKIEEEHFAGEDAWEIVPGKTPWREHQVYPQR